MRPVHPDTGRESPFRFDPERHLIERLDLRERTLQEGVNLVARDPDSGVMLWARVVDGAPVAWRCTDQEFQFIETITFYKPDPDPMPGPDGPVPLSDPLDDPLSDPFIGRGPIWMDDSTEDPPKWDPKPGCPYVCAATGNGGMICWKECPKSD